MAADRPSVADASPLSFQDLILTLQRYWSAQGCALAAALRHRGGRRHAAPATVLRALGAKPWKAAYVQPSRRPADGRYGENPNRLQHYYQFQVILKPNPPDLQDALSRLAAAIGLDPHAARYPLRGGRLGEPHRRRLGPRLGGVVRRDGGDAVHLLPGRRRHRGGGGLRRADLRAGAAGHVCAGRGQRLRPAPSTSEGLTYGEVFLENERQNSAFNFEVADVETLKRQFEDMERDVPRILGSRGPQGQALVLPAYDRALKASHLFNLMDARGAIAVAERAELHRPHPRPR